jgi:hypothetical protein
MSGDVLHLSYSRAALRADYLRASAGILMCAAAAVLAGPTGWAFWAFGTLTLIFLAFAVNIAVKHMTRLDIESGELRRILTLPTGTALTLQRLDLSKLERFRLCYFGRRRRDKGKGIVELRLRAGGKSLVADQTLERFDDLVTLVHEAAEKSGIALDDATNANLSALGFQ